MKFGQNLRDQYLRKNLGGLKEVENLNGRVLRQWQQLECCKGGHNVRMLLENQS